MIPASRSLSALDDRGLAIAVIDIPKKSFVLGSFPVVKLTTPHSSNLRDIRTEAWLPVSSRIAIGLGQAQGTETIIQLNEQSLIRDLNMAIAKQSTMFAAASEQLVRSLSKTQAGVD
jgi:hypothetical protein